MNTLLPNQEAYWVPGLALLKKELGQQVPQAGAEQGYAVLSIF